MAALPVTQLVEPQESRKQTERVYDELGAKTFAVGFRTPFVISLPEQISNGPVKINQNHSKTATIRTHWIPTQVSKLRK